MFELVVFLALMCLLLIVKIVFDQADKKQADKEPAGVEKSSQKTALYKQGKFRGFKIKPGENCCYAAQLIEDKVFTADTKMPLPLPDCSQESCSCERQVVNERRHLHRRQMGDRRLAIRFEPDFKDRRQSFGRRKDDDNTFDGGYRH